MNTLVSLLPLIGFCLGIWMLGAALKHDGDVQ